MIARIQGMACLFLGAMNDDAGHAFLRLGPSLERADVLARLLLASLAELGAGRDELRAGEWVGVLRSVMAYQMYRRSMRRAVTRGRELRFLVGSNVFPPSLAYCAAEAAARSAMAGRAEAGSGDERRIASMLPRAQAGLVAIHEGLHAAHFAPLPVATGQVQVMEA